MNPRGENFPLTHYSLVSAAQSCDPAVRAPAIERIAAAYWRPIYKYIRLRWNVDPEDAADFTQDFFTRLLEKEFLDSYDAAKGRLRTFLRTCADRLIMNRFRNANRLKRGAGSLVLSLDLEHAERELSMATKAGSPEDLFEREWIRSLLALGVERLRAHCEEHGKSLHFRLFERYDLNEEDSKPSYSDLAREHHVAQTDVTNYLSFARREFRRCVLEELRLMTSSEEEFRREARVLLGRETR